jgi:ribose-phosphate pyrophosphokinase
LFSGKAIQLLQDAPIVEVVCTDTIELPEEKSFPKLVQLSIAELIGQGIINIIDDQALSTLFQ